MRGLLRTFLCLMIIFVAYGFSSSEDKSAAKNAKEPTAVISICFDDAHASVFTMGLPILQQYDLPAVLYVPTVGIDEKAFWHMSWNQIGVIEKAGWEIGSHSHTHRNMTQLATEQIEEELTMSKQLLARRGFTATSFAVPFGESEKITDLVKEHYKSQRGTEKVRGVELDLSLNDLGVDPFHLTAIELQYNYPFEKIKNLIDRAVAEKKWAIFYLHSITDVRTDDVSFQFDLQKLNAIAAYLAQLQDQGKLKVMTVSGYLSTRGQN